MEQLNKIIEELEQLALFHKKQVIDLKQTPGDHVSEMMYWEMGFSYAIDFVLSRLQTEGVIKNEEEVTLQKKQHKFIF
ncbi:hypothetical protein [Alicyclobacillus fodiniaquatilis]|uniref:Uncharacterized protein n=1 Tax=Alicyclobacillus fodiniaquatilis TaxID=1661150 RepID=A0ABW4JDZ4_9BACL